MASDWAELVREHGPAVWRTVYRILNHEADAADAYQETFLAAVALGRERPVENWGAVLRSIAARRAIDRLRHRIRTRNRLRKLTDGISQEAPPAGAAQSAELVERLREALGRLPKKQAQVFWLRAIEELSYREIAAELGIEVNEVGVLLHRARARLQRLMSADEGRVPR